MSFNAFMTHLKETLNGRSVLVYYRAPLPAELDEVVETAVARFLAATDGERADFHAALTHEERALFGIYSHRATALAMREEADKRLWNGLIASVIANYVLPEKRRPQALWTVYHHCGRRLEIDVADLFARAAVYAQPDLAHKMIAFGRRGDVSLRLAGWREVKREDGVWYKFG